jgi:hypothetical protein
VSGPFYANLYGGFLVVEEYAGPDMRKVTKTYTVPDVRLATPWPSFADADRRAKQSASQLYPPDLRYFAILAAVRN